MKRKLNILSYALAAVAYAYMVATTAMSTGEGLSLTTFGLWAALAWITVYTTYKQKANPWIPAIYGIGSTSTAIVLLYKGRFEWSALNTVVAILAIICIIILLVSGPRWSLIMAICSALIAGIPFVIMTWRNPAVSPILANSVFLVANTMALIGAKAWTIEDRLYPVANVLLCLLLIIPWFIK